MKNKVTDAIVSNPRISSYPSREHDTTTTHRLTRRLLVSLSRLEKQFLGAQIVRAIFSIVEHGAPQPRGVRLFLFAGQVGIELHGSIHRAGSRAAASRSKPRSNFRLKYARRTCRPALNFSKATRVPHRLGRGWSARNRTCRPESIRFYGG